MGEIVESVKIIAGLLTLFPFIIGVFKFSNKIFNRNELERHIVQYDKKKWEDFGEILLICLFLVLGVNAFVILPEFPFLAKVAIVLLPYSSWGLIITVLVVGLISLYYQIPKFIRKDFLSRFVYVLTSKMPFILLFFVIITNAAYSALLSNVDEVVPLETWLIYLTTVYIMYVAMILISLSNLKYIATPSSAAIKVQVISSPEKKLKDLCFIYSMDNERHVMSYVPVKKNKLVLPAYIYFPKENRLIKYYREEVWLQK